MVLVLINNNNNNKTWFMHLADALSKVIIYPCFQCMDSLEIKACSEHAFQVIHPLFIFILEINI